jgi:hypothetical protein
MRKKYLPFVTVCFLLAALFLGNCGGSGPGAPGSSGSEDTGILPTVTAITHNTVVSNQGDEWEIDLIQDVCTGGTLEKWGNDYAEISFTGQYVNPNVTSNNQLYVTNYTVSFLAVNPSNPTIPAIVAGSQGAITIVPNTTTGPFTFLVFSTGMKEQLVQDLKTINSVPSFPLQYNMEIVLYGQDNYGNSFTVGPIIRLINIQDYNNC